MTHIQNALQTIDIEINALNHLKQQINEQFTQACETILQCQGRVIVIGMGKSGHIASKIAATLASTGTPAFFVHPAEAGHGDFGMITKTDVVIAISNSGTTPEVTALIPMIKMLGIPLISITSKPESVLAKNSHIVLNLDTQLEACPHNLAPTCSTTATLVLGDALAIALLKAKNFTPSDFAFSHPSGALGKRLLLKVSDIMRNGDAIPCVLPTTKIEEAILEISAKSIGATFIADDTQKLLGVFTDGDLRRLFAQGQFGMGQSIEMMMHKSPKTISPDTMAISALEKMENYKISALAVIDEQQRLVGVVTMHDLIEQGIA